MREESKGQDAIDDINPRLVPVLNACRFSFFVSALPNYA